MANNTNITRIHEDGMYIKSSHIWAYRKARKQLKTANYYFENATAMHRKAFANLNYDVEKTIEEYNKAVESYRTAYRFLVQAEDWYKKITEDARWHQNNK